MRLSDESNVGVNSFGNWYLPDFNSGVAVTSFTASFDSLIYKPGTINPANTGDFFGFNFGTITGQTAFSNGNGGIQGPNATNVLTVTFRTLGTNRSRYGTTIVKSEGRLALPLSPQSLTQARIN